jgi:hypothetical protein
MGFSIGTILGNAGRDAIGAVTLGAIRPGANNSGWAQGSSGITGGGGESYAASQSPYVAPQYTTIADNATGKLPTQFTLTNPLASGPNYLSQLDTERKSLADLSNPWVTKMREQIGSDYLSQRDAAQKNIASQIQQSMETLASRGGARSGAREQLAASGGNTLFSNLQQLGRQRADQLRGVDTKAYETSLGILEKLPALQAQQAGIDLGVQQQNVGNMINEKNYAFDQQMKAYETQMAAWAARQQALATAEAGRPGFVSSILGSNGLF